MKICFMGPLIYILPRAPYIIKTALILVHSKKNSEVLLSRRNWSELGKKVFAPQNLTLLRIFLDSLLIHCKYRCFWNLRRKSWSAFEEYLDAAKMKLKNVLLFLQQHFLSSQRINYRKENHLSYNLLLFEPDFSFEWER